MRLSHCTTPPHARRAMRRRALAVIAALSLVGAGVAAASHVPTVDPASVPVGFLAAHSHVPDVPEKPFRRISRARGGMDVFLQHVRLTAGTATAWHTHPGPAVVTVASGTLTFEDACLRRTYPAGTGFVDEGFGHVHRAVAGADGADFYVTYLLPHGTPSQLIPTDPPSSCRHGHHHD
jgi:quercetin dioxygenase-like cupin family protein